MTITILDSSLRDGAQAEGISFSVSDKLRVARALDNLGITYIEAGTPFSGPKDAEVFRKLRDVEFKTSKITAFGATRRKDKTAKADPAIAALVESGASVVSVFGKAWDFHVTQILKAGLDENLKMISDTVSYLKTLGREVIFDAEHFFDGYKHNPGYAMSALKAAAGAGADILCLCDTNGGAFPLEVFEITKTVCSSFTQTIGIHCHNDCGMAVANSVMAVSAGALHIQGTLTGFGERCGNAALSAIIPNLQLKQNLHVLSEEKLALLTPTCLAISETANETLKKREPYVGKSAFAHKGGMHIDGVTKQPSSFEHIDPIAVGNTRRLLTSEMSGRQAVLTIINRINPKLNKNSPEVKEIMRVLKQREQDGYQYEAAESSFELLIRKQINAYKPFFDLIDFFVVDKYPDENSRATIKLSVNGKTRLTAADGNGPVNALDKALRQALEGFYPTLSNVRLTDYKVRVLDGGSATAAKVRVLIESADDTKTWSTVGVSANIVQASWLALVDSIEYKLIKDEISL